MMIYYAYHFLLLLCFVFVVVAAAVIKGACHVHYSPYEDEDVPLVELCTLYLHACQVKVTVGDSGLCCCACVMSFER